MAVVALDVKLDLLLFDIYFFYIFFSAEGVVERIPNIGSSSS